MGLVIGLGGGNAGGGGGAVASGLIQDMEGVTWTGTAEIAYKTITEFPGADCRYLTSLENMFKSCKSLVSVGDLKNNNNVISTYSMFIYCSSLQEAPFFDTSAVITMQTMFYYCDKLVKVPLYNTSSVTNMQAMFSNCSNLQEVPAFDTSAVTNMSSMFQYCSKLLTVPAFDTSKVNTMNSMFSQCYKLKTIPAFDTSEVTNTGSMFYYCGSLTSIGGTLDMIKVTSDGSASYMFTTCKLLETVNISNLGVSLDLSWCKVLSVDSVLFLFNNAQSGVSGKTIQLNSLVFDQLTEDQIAIATEKGFSVTSVVRS